MKERLKGIFERVPKWVRGVVACVVVILVAVVVDYYIQDYIYKSKCKIVADNFKCVFQVDKIEQKDEKLILKGWVFKLEENSKEKDFDIILYDYANKEEIYLTVKDTVRKDVNDYFLCEYDYSNSGFVASIELKKIDLDETNYEIIIREKGVRKAYKSGTYISKGELMYALPEKYVPLDVKNTDIEEIVSKGILRVYMPEQFTYVYQYKGRLYWIVEEGYPFNEESGRTKVQYHLETTQTDKLPEKRLKGGYLWDNISFHFEKKEVLDIDTGKYRVTVADIPTEYAVTKIWTGYYSGDWVWKYYFRPWYEFD